MQARIRSPAENEESILAQAIITKYYGLVGFNNIKLFSHGSGG